MKVLLVAMNASYVHTNLAVRLLRASTKRPVVLLEMTINESRDVMLQKFCAKSPTPFSTPPISGTGLRYKCWAAIYARPFPM